MVKTEEMEISQCVGEDKLQEELLALANEGKYEEYLEKVREGGEEVSLMEAKERFIVTSLTCKKPHILLENIYPHLYPEEYEKEFSEEGLHLEAEGTDLLCTLMDRAVIFDDEVLMEWLVNHSAILEDSDEGLQYSSQVYLDYAIIENSLKCMKYLLSLDKDWNITPWIFFMWSLQNTGYPHLNSCIAELGAYFLPKEEGEQVSPHEYFRYPTDIPFEKLYDMALCSTNSYNNVIDEFIEFHACSPFMKHCIEYKLLGKKEIDLLIKRLEKNITSVLCGRELNEVRISFLNPRLTGNFELQDMSPLEYKFYPDFYQDSVLMLDSLLTHYPKIIQRQRVRSLVAALALVDDPYPSMLERVQNFRGKHLVIANYDLPWFEDGVLKNANYISHTLFYNWERRMPKGMKPGIAHSKPIICPIFDEVEIDLFLWLQYCDVVGNPPKSKVSEIGMELLKFPCDSPLFVGALQENGILHREKKNYMKVISERRHEFRSHYLLSISLLKEEKTYEL